MNFVEFLPIVQDYIQKVDLSLLPFWAANTDIRVSPLAQGEYNMNYLLTQGSNKWVLRVNIGSQIQREDQIQYEYNALKLLGACGYTPKPYFLDDSRDIVDHGVLIMEYFPGDHLIYARDHRKAARLFAAIHSYSHDVPDFDILIPEDLPLSMMYAECFRLLQEYFNSPLSNPTVKDYLKDVLAWADNAKNGETYFIESPWKCLINTEVNSSNFIIDPDREKIFLVDWEKPLWGDPSQDLSHFLVPTTTLWKTDFRFSDEERKAFLETYKHEINDPLVFETIEHRVRMRDPFNCLRGVSWCAMAWVQYRSGGHALQNPSTFKKLDLYVDMNFLRSLFDPVMKSGGK